MATLSKSGTPSMTSTVPCDGTRISGLLAGEAIAAGDSCYVKSDGKVWRSNGAAANAAAKADGIAFMAAAVGKPVTLHRNVIFAYGSGLTPGARYYVSATLGALDDAATTGGTAPVAFAINATEIYFVGSYY